MAQAITATAGGIDLSPDLHGQVYLAFATGHEASAAAFLDRVAEENPDSTLLVVARHRPHRGEWVEMRPGQGTGATIAACRKAIGNRSLRGAAVHATRRGREWRMRIAAYVIVGRNLRIYNDNLDHFRFGDTAILWQHLKWRWQERRRGVLWWELLGGLAILCGRDRHFRRSGTAKSNRSPLSEPKPDGISLVIPSRDGKDLLMNLLPQAVADLPPLTAGQSAVQGVRRLENGSARARVAVGGEVYASEIIVVDNGSTDGTAAFLRECYPEIRIESSPSPLSFAEAVNRGIQAARYSHVVLLNNDMLIEPHFFSALRSAFDRVPNLFCATAQIFFPEGHRREETGLCFWSPNPGDDFPVYCDEPRGDEDGTLVLYGSGGCSMYEAAKLRALGGFDESYRPAYVEDLDIGYRAWQRGWPTVFCAGARVLHHHRATTSRYYNPEYLDYLVERNYLRFLVRSTGDIFPELWRAAIARLKARAANGDGAARRALRAAWREALSRRAYPSSIDERELKRSLTR